MSLFNKISDKVIRGGGIFMFLRSSMSSQVASWADLGSSIGLVALGVSKWVATPVGAVIGGVVNCLINYRFTFRANKQCSLRSVAVKYVMIWIGSVVFNTVGTSLLADLLDRWHLLEMLGFTNVGSFAAARLIVSLVVSLAWNYLMQKNFVYRPTRFDPTAESISRVVCPDRGHNHNMSKNC